MGEKSSLKFEGKSSCFTRPLRIFAFFVVPEGNPTVFRFNVNFTGDRAVCNFEENIGFIEDR